MLALDAVETAGNGHPGMPMGMADIAEVLWNDYLRFSPTQPHWHDRDRFVLSNGHGSMLLYAIAYLTGYALDVEELKRFRQLGSRIAGHPEREIELGIETTTGPLGQGLANAVGMALTERTLAATFNKPDATIVDHHTYVFLGDGCLMEGISHEACSFAGMQKLGKLVGFYDDNGISIDGATSGWFTDDTPKRFEAYGWHVVPNVDGHDPDAIRAAIDAARARRRSAVADLLQDRDRLRRAERAGHVRHARRGARRGRGRGRSQELGLGLAAVRDSRRREIRVGRARARPRVSRRIGRRGSPGTGTATRSSRLSSSGACAATCRGLGRSMQMPRCRASPRQPNRWRRAKLRRLALEAFAPALPELDRRLGGPRRAPTIRGTSIRRR